MRICLRSLLVLLTLAYSLGLPAQAADEEPIRLAIKEYLDRQTKGFAEPARYEIGKVAAGGLAAGCRRISVNPSSGNRSWGRIHLQVRCAEGANWSMFIPVEVHLIADYLVTARPIRSGQIIAEADLAVRRGDLAELPPNVLVDASQAIGQTSIAALNAEQALRADHLRKPVVVHQGQTTRVISTGPGFQVAGEGKAMGNAVAGQVVQVRMISGQTVSGIAQTDGSVRVAQ